MPIPTSDTWPCMDVGSAEMAAFLTQPGVDASRGFPYFSIDGNNDLVVYSDDGIASTLHIDLALADTFTIQFSFKPSTLPPDLSTGARLFIGGYNSQSAQWRPVESLPPSIRFPLLSNIGKSFSSASSLTLYLLSVSGRSKL